VQDGPVPRADRALGRVPRLGKAFFRSCSRILVAGSPAARETFEVVRRLAGASTLPLIGDGAALLREPEIAFVEEVEGRRVVSAYAHRVKRRRLWILYRVTGRDDQVEVILLVRVAPRFA
jgi:hypothetical protein